MKQVKYFKYSTFGRVTCYTGPMAGGLTLGAVIQIVKQGKGFSNVLYSDATFPQSDKFRPIIALPFTPDVMANVRNSTVFLDFVDRFTDRSTVTKEARLFFYWMQYLRKFNMRLIFTTHYLEYIDRAVRDSITTMIGCKYDSISNVVTLVRFKMLPKTAWEIDITTGKRRRTTRLVWTPISYVKIPARKYFKYYNTLEVSNEGQDLTTRYQRL
jgi:hypothetical protein